MSIFHTLSNLNYGGTLHKAGDIFEGKIEEYESLVTDKVLRVIEEAETLEQAAKIVAKETAEKIAEAELAEEQKPENTWGPKKDPTPEEVEEANKKVDTTEKAPIDTNTEVKTDVVAPGTVGQGDQAPAGTENAGDNL